MLNATVGMNGLISARIRETDWRFSASWGTNWGSPLWECLRGGFSFLNVKCSLVCGPVLKNHWMPTDAIRNPKWSKKNLKYNSLDCRQITNLFWNFWKFVNVFFHFDDFFYMISIHKKDLQCFCNYLHSLDQDVRSWLLPIYTGLSRKKRSVGNLLISQKLLSLWSWNFNPII